MSSSIKENLNDAIKQAMKAHDKDRLSVLRMAAAAFKQIEVDERIELDDQRALALIEKQIKQRKESAEQFTRGNREELAAKELAEIEILRAFLPEQLSAEALQKIIQEAIRVTGAQSMKEMGKVMALIKPQVQGRTDMGALSGQIKSLLS
ncbi:Conserved hypothetical protein [gamma proteobacterium HdN1]|nr:Conserved hypothetical protein [gamma proteobacterium HdN1]